MVDAVLPVIKGPTGYDPVMATPVLVVGEDGAPASLGGDGGGGDASAANQTTEIARLTSILAKIITAPATEAKQDTGNTTLGATGDAAATQGSTGSVSAKLRTVTAQLNTLHTDSANVTAGEYETVAASQTDQALGAAGATGDYLEAVLIVPGTTAAGAVSIKDGSGSSISIFAGGGTTALADLAPIYVPLAIISTSGAWKITTGSNVTAIGIGNFT
jgi:hypothetical protein